MARTKALAASLAAILIAVWPMQALAQEGPYDPLGLRFGGFDVHAGIDAGVESTDNLYANNFNEQSETITTTSVYASASSHWSRHSLSANVGASSRAHDEHGEYDTDAVNAGIRGRVDVYNDTQIGGGVSFADSFEPRTDSDSPVSGTELAPVEYDVATADIYGQHTFNRVRVGLRAGQTQYDYDDVTQPVGPDLDQDFRDYKESWVGGRVEYGMSPRVYLFADASGNERKYDTAVGRDSKGNSVLGGVRLQLTDLVVGEIGVGRFSQDYDSGSIDGTGYSANVTWFATPITNFQVNASRQVEESGAYQGGYIGSSYGVRVNHSPRRFLNFTAGVNAGEREYRGTLESRNDEYLSADFSGEYLMNRRVRVRAGYSFDRNRSSATLPVTPGNEFDSNRFFLGLGLRL